MPLSITQLGIASLATGYCNATLACAAVAMGTFSPQLGIATVAMGIFIVRLAIWAPAIAIGGIPYLFQTGKWLPAPKGKGAGPSFQRFLLGACCKGKWSFAPPNKNAFPSVPVANSPLLAICSLLFA